MPQARPSTISPVGEGSSSGRSLPTTGVGETDGSFLRVVSPDALTSFEKAEQQRAEEERRQSEALSVAEVSSLAAWVRSRYHFFRTERQTRGTEHALLSALRTFRGQYSPSQLAEIQKFGGTTAFSRVVASKCRGASALLREVYLSGERPWNLEPTPDPKLPPDLEAAINTLLAAEQGQLALMQQEVPEDAILARQEELQRAAEQRAYEIAHSESRQAADKVNDMLVQGGFYTALKEVLQDIPIFPYAVLKGPAVRNITTVSWNGQGQAVPAVKAQMCWSRVSPFDFFWAPGAGSVRHAEVLERWKVSRAELNACIGVKGFFDDAILDVLDAYGRGGLSDWLNESDTERAWIERKEDPQENRSGLIDAIEYHGAVQGRQLQEGGVPLENFVPEGHKFNPQADYMVQVILVGAYVIKVMANVDPLKRHPYYVTSYEKVPGAVPGHGLPEILASEDAICNATLRALVNNLSIASGPQVILNTDRLDPSVDDDTLYPWRRWHVLNDPLGRGTDRPVEFYQPQSNAQELIQVYQAMMTMADENSALPRYQTGGSKASGAARTASGLSMLTQASNRVLMQVASNIDEDVLQPALRHLYDLLMLTDREGLLRGDESIVVRGATRMAQKETDRMRQLEFLQMTSNPVDMQIVGPEGRAALLRNLSQNIGLPGEEIVPSREEMRLQNRQQEMAQTQLPPMGTTVPGPGAGGLEAETDNAMRTNVA